MKKLNNKKVLQMTLNDSITELKKVEELLRIRYRLNWKSKEEDSSLKY